jgi:hypothetical protein
MIISPALSVEFRKHETLSVGAVTAVPLTAANLSSEDVPAKVVKLTLDSGSIRYWENGQDPTASVGHKWDATFGPLYLTARANLTGLRIISTSGTLAVSVSYGF